MTCAGFYWVITGGSYLVPRSIYENWVAGKDVVGRGDGQFMTSKSAMDRLLQEANGDMSIVKQRLGIPQNQWNEPLVRVDVMNPLLHNARLPSGLNSGVNSQFQWGGYTSGGMPELITNPIPKSDIRATIISGNE